MAFDKSALAGAIITEDLSSKELGEAEAASFKFVFGRPPNGQYFQAYAEFTSDLWFYIRQVGPGSKDHYLVVDPEAQSKYRTRLTPLRCALIVDEDGVIYVWAINFRLKGNVWVDTALECLGMAETGPIEVSTSDKGYTPNRPPTDYEFPEVFLPELELGVVEAVAAALGDRSIISAADHPQLTRLGTPIRRKEAE